MRFSTKSQYGLRAAVCLAKRNKVTSLKKIAKNENIPFDYLEKIISKLEKAEIVKSKRGAYGGYFLARPASKITVSQIVKVLEGTIAPVLCIAEEKSKKFDCPHEEKCLTKNVWKKVQDALNETLNSIILADLINEKK